MVMARLEEDSASQVTASDSLVRGKTEFFSHNHSFVLMGFSNKLSRPLFIFSELLLTY